MEGIKWILKQKVIMNLMVTNYFQFQNTSTFIPAIDPLRTHEYCKVDHVSQR